MSERIISGLKRGKQYFRSFDYFGIPIKVNFEGQTTYKTLFGAVVTAIFAGVMLAQVWLGFDKMLNRTDPDYSFYKLTQSWRKNEPLSLPEIGGQVYIGLQENKEYIDGSKVTRFIDFDPAFVNGKIDYYDQSNLSARKNMPLCENVDDYTEKIKNSNGLTMADFDVLRCIPNENYLLYNVAGTSEQNSITLIFEECGGKYAKTKEFESVLKQEAIQAAIDAGEDPASIQIETWLWNDPNCDPTISDCDYGLDTLPVYGETDSDQTKFIYQDCSETPDDEDCVESWDIVCDMLEVTCLTAVVRDSCDETDINCQVNFLRAFCDKFDPDVCQSEPFQRGLNKENGCLPGQWKCIGFHEMFGGPKGIAECTPWDLQCALRDQYEQSNSQLEAFPYMKAMPKSLLTLKEAAFLEYVIYLKHDITLWRKGFKGDALTFRERDSFYTLGTMTLTAEGFNDIFQSVKITKRVQTDIDANVRLFLSTQLEVEPLANLPLMPTSTIRAIEWNLVNIAMDWKLGEIWANFQAGQEQPIRDEAALQIALSEMYGSASNKNAILEGTVTEKQQVEIDSRIREFIIEHEFLTEEQLIEVVTIVPRMPYTKVQVAQWTRIDEITQFMIADIWKRAFVDNDTDLTEQEKDAVFQIGIQLYGSESLFEKFAGTDADFTESEQGEIDTAARAFIERYQLLQEEDIIYRGARGDILNMPLSTITFKEWSQIKKIMNYKLGSDAFERRFSGLSTLQREIFAIDLAMVELLGSQDLYSLWLSNSIEQANQTAVDTNARSFIGRHAVLTKSDQIVPRMPFTTLDLEDIALIEQIITFRVQDLWVRRFDFGETLSETEQARLKELGESLMGVAPFQKYSETVLDLNLADQSTADTAMNAFRDENRLYVDIATIERMPFTKTSVANWERVQVIITFLLNNLWARFTENPNQSFTPQERSALSEAGSQFFGSEELWLKYFETETAFNEVEQTDIDEAINSFLLRYTLLEEKDIIYRGKKDDIVNMPLTTITYSEWDKILATMQYKLGNDAFERWFDRKQINQRESFAFNTAMVQFLGSEANFELWQTNSITAGAQSAIDANIREFLAEHDPLQSSDQIIPRMPETELLFSEIEAIEKIIAQQIGDLWVRRYDLGETNFTLADFTSLVTLGNELMGSSAYQIYSLTSNELTREQQSLADKAMKSFLATYRDDVEVASISNMPLTTLTKTEYSNILKLLEASVGDLFQRYATGDQSLTLAERQTAEQLTIQVFGEAFVSSIDNRSTISEGNQPGVDAASREWLAANSDSLTGRRRSLFNGRKLERKVAVNQKNGRRLQTSLYNNKVQCASAQQIRDYLQDKTIVVYATQSFVKEGDNQSELVQYLEPLAEKRLDFKYHKKMEAVIQKQTIEIQDSYYQIFQPEPEILTFPETRIQFEDISTREYWDGDAQEYVNTQESMLTIKMWLETTTTEQRRTAYDSMTLLGDIGGLYDFFVIFVTPLVALIVGDRLTYHILGKLFMVRDPKRPGIINGNTNCDTDSEDKNNSDTEAKQKRWRNWLKGVVPYRTNWKTRCLHNKIVRLITCRFFLKQKADPGMQMLENGQRRLDRDLDIRNLIKAQDLLKTLMKLKVSDSKKRKLMRLQRRNCLLEPSKDDSDDSEEDFKEFMDSYTWFQDEFDEMLDDDEKLNQSDIQSMRLFRGVLQKDALDPKRNLRIKTRHKTQAKPLTKTSQVAVKAKGGLNQSSSDSETGTPKSSTRRKAALFTTSNNAVAAIKSSGSSGTQDQNQVANVGNSFTSDATMPLNSLQITSSLVSTAQPYNSGKKTVNYDLSSQLTGGIVTVMNGASQGSSRTPRNAATGLEKSQTSTAAANGKSILPNIPTLKMKKTISSSSYVAGSRIQTRTKVTASQVKDDLKELVELTEANDQGGNDSQ